MEPGTAAADAEKAVDMDEPIDARRSVTSSTGAGKTPFVEIAQKPGRSYGWACLAERQAALAEKFGDVWAYPTLIRPAL